MCKYNMRLMDTPNRRASPGPASSVRRISAPPPARPTTATTAFAAGNTSRFGELLCTAEEPGVLLYFTVSYFTVS